ncbi:DUF6146 family protein [Seonamhaeicola aphaedonensis]|uniref:Lipoprotein n=1 Tax=Seonamhaeicola aphaedonensis TaxID=1461338 RepID=A0A3D9H8P0_9FLAO|nr:DUF6146 family protein [Seonamhaeicola aphaedonensis]RED45862.1 hypothetical protein DFQ02_1077 [Seonamhaeicola aphaedonensis]
MKKIFYILITSLLLAFGCNSTKKISSNTYEKNEAVKANDTVKIANEALEYEIIIIDPGFSFWLASTARPEGFYSQQFMERRNSIFVIEWNQRVLQPARFNPNLYELQIDYDPNIDYGYEVNYKLYNYFIYFQLKYNQRLGPFQPRI